MSLVLVFYQDVKTRLVYGFLFPIIALCSGLLLYNNVHPAVFKTTVMINLCFAVFLIMVVLAYSKLKLKISLNQTFGLGDALLFLALAFTFASITFLILFVFGLVFSLVLHLLLKSKSKHGNVPLAGYLSLFFAITYTGYWSGIIISVYSI